MINYFSKYKFFFYFLNLVIIVLYLFPYSFLGCLFYNDCKFTPKITPDLVFSDITISSNHFFAFFFLSIIGVFTFKKLINIIFVFVYLLFLSLFLEVMHYFLPNRSFEFSDLFGNFAGVIVVILIFYSFRKNENFKN